MNRLARLTFIYWLPAIAWMVFIFSLSSIRGSDLPDAGMPGVDKAAHIAEYLILGFLLTRAVSGSFQNINLAKLIVSVIIIASLYSIYDEWHQQFVQGRVCDILDFIADFFGVIIGILFYKMRGKNGAYKTF